MRKATLVFAFLLGVAGAPDAAAGGNLVWGEGCLQDNPWQVRRDFACDTNEGYASFVGSFVLLEDMPGFLGIEAIVDGWSMQSDLPDWWQLYNPGSCRQHSLSVSADFTSAPGGCVDMWQGRAMGGIGAWQTMLYPPPYPLNVPAPDACRLKLVFALAESTLLVAGTEYYGFRVRVDFQKTVGTDACAGCAAGLCIFLGQIKAVSMTAVQYAYSHSMYDHIVAWNFIHSECYRDPTRNVTWGRVKSLYR
jgi:hypothetical protein